jgi:hypothetical protein
MRVGLGFATERLTLSSIDGVSSRVQLVLYALGHNQSVSSPPPASNWDQAGSRKVLVGMPLRILTRWNVGNRRYLPAFVGALDLRQSRRLALLLSLLGGLLWSPKKRLYCLLEVLFAFWPPSAF